MKNYKFIFKACNSNFGKSRPIACLPRRVTALHAVGHQVQGIAIIAILTGSSAELIKLWDPAKQ